MSREDNRHDRPVSDHLHPLVYIAVIGFAGWFALSVWSFATDGYTDYLLAVVSGFIFMAVALPAALWRVWRKSQGRAAVRKNKESFGDWAAGDFETWQDRLKGANAAVEIVMPIAAAAFGMTAFGIVLYFTAHHAI